MEDAVVIEFLQRQARGAKYVTSVCTGSLVLGAAGLLKGYRSACHWAWRDMLVDFGAIPVAERVAERSLALPFFTSISEGQIERVCTALVEALDTRP